MVCVASMNTLDVIQCVEILELDTLVLLNTIRIPCNSRNLKR
jgi:hypothetical protein